MTPYVELLLSYIRPEAQGAFVYEYRQYAKDPTIAQMLAIFLGFIGGESYYFGDWKRGIWMTLGLLTGIGGLITIPMWIVRCFTISNECLVYNDYLAYTLAYRYLPAGTTPQPPEPPQAAPQNSARRIGGLPMTARG